MSVIISKCEEGGVKETAGTSTKSSNYHHIAHLALSAGTSDRLHSPPSLQIREQCLRSHYLVDCLHRPLQTNSS